MSTAGKHSNRGDHYQTLIAFEWALTVLADPEFEWLEIDSTSYEVDDIVIGKSDGTVICCQCKKNQTKSRAWSVADLSDELKKAFSLLVRDEMAVVRFYSRSEFGPLANLREHNLTQGDENSYLSSLGITHKKTEEILKDLIPVPEQLNSTFTLLRKITFESTSDFDRLKQKNKERLRFIVSNPDQAYNALWVNLSEFGAGVTDRCAPPETSHRLSKSDLNEIIADAGSLLTSPIDEQEVKESFRKTSAIGRAWKREIAGSRIPSITLGNLLKAIDEKKRSILLTGMPGSGKTCVMLSLQEELEKQVRTGADIIPLFIQSREYADLSTVDEREAFGLSNHWVEDVARMADETHTIIIIDSLDVLSIAREHHILNYFLAKIDQLLLFPNVTVITACRDFDRRYDHRIAERTWDCELNCEPLNWETAILPLLASLNIETDSITTETRSLIQNPRELALFVELAQQKGSFNVVTSQELAQKYLDAFVKENIALDDHAMEAIEDVAQEMLKNRKLSVPSQRFSGTQSTKRILLSQNILRETEEKELTFGHQTLLDVLVISRAICQSITLNEFIKSLPPVPFVRPSIRSFVSQLAAGDRREFRRQIRAVLTGSSAFHIRRLVAEAFAELAPQDEDWSLIRKLRNNYREVFQVIYGQAKRIEWHNFWFAHLVPYLKELQDTEGLSAHIHAIAQWKNQDPEGIISFWMECLELDWINDEYLVDRLPFHLEKIDSQHLKQATPLLIEMLKRPQPQHSFIGHATARFIEAGALEDKWLWHYIIGDISEQDILQYRFDNKLRCNPHDFGLNRDSFLEEKISNSTTLLNLALQTLEEWSHKQSKKYNALPSCGFQSNFLRNTSYRTTHDKSDIHHLDDEDFLLQAVETAIRKHICENSAWWIENQNRICFSREGAFRYISIMGCIENPIPNLNLIARTLNDFSVLNSKLSFEVGSLILAAFVYLPASSQDIVMNLIMNMHNDEPVDENHLIWELRPRAEYISCIPCHLRSLDAQTTLDEYEAIAGPVSRMPRIETWGGFVHAPFSFEVFLKITPQQIILLLKHYQGYERHFDEYGTGGAPEVGGQLREASSRKPNYFLNLLSSFWNELPARSRNDIVDGISNYLRYTDGNLKPGDKWEAIEQPASLCLANSLLEELEKHPNHWQHNNSAAHAIEACANVIKDTEIAARLSFLAIGFLNLHSADIVRTAHSEQLSSNVYILNDVAEGLMILANRFAEHDIQYPELLGPTLRQFAKLGHKEIQTSMLDRLPNLQYKNPELGWEVFHLCMQDSEGLWGRAERCLYHAYRDHYKSIVAPLLLRIPIEGTPEEMETWGRISALCALTDKVNHEEFIESLILNKSPEAWKGATGVWTHAGNMSRDREKCLMGIEYGLNQDTSIAIKVAQEMDSLFRDDARHISIPTELICLSFRAYENDSEKTHHHFFSIEDWILAKSKTDPVHTLEVTEIYLSFMKKTQGHLHDHKNSFSQLMTRFFAEAEEQELSDNGEMLKRVVALQDLLLSLGLESINDWLKAAERP